jgi:hypothetical protein
MVSFYFQKLLLELDIDEVNEFVFSVVKEKTGSSACVRDTVFGLRFFLCLCGLDDLVLRLISLRNDGEDGNLVRGRLSLTPLGGTGTKQQ